MPTDHHTLQFHLELQDAGIGADAKPYVNPKDRQQFDLTPTMGNGNFIFEGYSDSFFYGYV